MPHMHTSPLIRAETCTCYNCGKKDHLLWFFQKPWKQQIWLAVSPEADLKSLVAEVVAITLDAQQVAEKLEKAKFKEDF